MTPSLIILAPVSSTALDLMPFSFPEFCSTMAAKLKINSSIVKDAADLKVILDGLISGRFKNIKEGVC